MYIFLVVVVIIVISIAIKSVFDWKEFNEKRIDEPEVAERDFLTHAKDVFRRKWCGDKKAIDEWSCLRETMSEEMIDCVAHAIYIEFAEQGDAKAMDCLTIDFAKGEGCEKNVEMARYWGLKAANAGNLEAILRLGNFYSLGEIFEENESEAIKWYTKGAEMGSVECQVELAQMYISSETRNVEEAIKLLISAASKGNVYAMYLLGMVYDNMGSGIEIYDEEKALFWYDAAARNGNKYAAAMRNILQRSIEKYGYIGVKKVGFVRDDWFTIANERLEETIKIQNQQLEELKSRK